MSDSVPIAAVDPSAVLLVKPGDRDVCVAACGAVGLRVVVSESLDSARELAAASTTALVVIDAAWYEDAAGDGSSWLGEQVDAGTPIFVVAPSADAEALQRVFEAGATDFIRAPLDAALVEARIRFALRNAARVRLQLAGLERSGREPLPRDPLTGLPNRRLFRDRLELAIASARRGNLAAGLMHVDIDGFGSINQSLGRAVGDELLKQVAERLAGCLRASDTVARPDGPGGPTMARLGGDEFLLVLQDLADSSEPSRIAARVVVELARPYFVGETELLVSASVGVAMYPADGEAEQLVRRAETALNFARDGGGNRAVFYSDRMNHDAAARLELANRLHRGLEQSEFELVFQPVFDTDERRVQSVEALLRWNDPDRGVIVPDDFVPLAEETGLILPLGDWVLDEACAQWRRWIDEGVGPVEISVNVSARQFRDTDMVERARSSIQRYDMDPEFLRFEITEKALTGAYSSAAGTIAELHAEGIGFAVDDFGTGLISLAELRSFPAEVLKIDRSFIKDLPESAEACSLVAAMVGMAHKLRMRVVAEGVETEAQLRFLTALDCEEVQGFLMGKPSSGAVIQPLLLRQLNRRVLPVVVPFRRRTAS